MIKRKISSNPNVLRGELVTAQEAHRASIEAANANLAATHDSVIGRASDRRKAVSEQIDLLDHEYRALGDVLDKARNA